MKTNKLKSLGLILLVSMSAAITGCMPTGGDEPTVPANPESPENPSDPDVPTVPSASDVYSFVLYAETADNIGGIIYSRDGQLVSSNGWRFAKIGQVSGLTYISVIPWYTWTESIGVSVGDGIVAYLPSVGFMRLYIYRVARDEYGNIVGVQVLYDKDFKGADEAIELATSMVEMPCEGGSRKISIENSSYTIYDVHCDAAWCQVEMTSDTGSFISDKIVVTLDANDSNEERICTVNVGTIYGKNTSLKIIQSGIPEEEE